MIKGLIISITSFIQSVITVILAVIISSIIVRIFNITNKDYVIYIFLSMLTAISFYVIYKNTKEIIQIRKGKNKCIK